MSLIRVENLTRAQPVVTVGEVADSYWRRLRGLIGSKPLEPGEGLLIVPCNSVHSHFMGFPIDVLYATGPCKWWPWTCAWLPGALADRTDRPLSSANRPPARSLRPPARRATACPRRATAYNAAPSRHRIPAGVPQWSGQFRQCDRLHMGTKTRLAPNTVQRMQPHSSSRCPDSLSRTLS